jgi:hypothetical protein
MLSFKDFLLEGYADRGFEYERKIQRILARAGIGLPSGHTAGSSHGADCYVVDSKGTKYGIEVKLDKNVFAGQKNIAYNLTTGNWNWSPNVATDLTKFYDEINLIDELVLPEAKPKLDKQIGLLNKWLKQNKIKTVIDSLPITLTNLQYTLFRRDNPSYTPELTKNFVTREAIFANYTAKEVYYMQIGGSGFYYLAEDPLGLAKYGVPQFNPDTVRVRSRLKWGGSTFEEGKENEDPIKANKTSTISFNNGLIVSGIEASPCDLDKDTLFLKTALGYTE